MCNTIVAGTFSWDGVSCRWNLAVQYKELFGLVQDRSDVLNQHNDYWSYGRSASWKRCPWVKTLLTKQCSLSLYMTSIRSQKYKSIWYTVYDIQYIWHSRRCQIISYSHFDYVEPLLNHTSSTAKSGLKGH